MFQNPSKFVRPTPRQDLFQLGDIKPISTAVIVFISFVVFTNILAVYKEKYTNCQKIVFLIPVILSVSAFLAVAINFGLVYAEDDSGAKKSNSWEPVVKDGMGWDCANTNYPLNPYTCWADQALEDCPDNQAIFDSVMLAGGSNKAAFDLFSAYKSKNCDISEL